MQTQSTNFQPQHASPSADAKPLHIAVVGAGLAGFAVATGLRRQGHVVEVFEASSFAREFGAAVGIPPNATLVLNHLGYKHDRLKSVDYFGSLTTDGSQDQNPVLHAFSRDSKSTWGHQWLCCHRVDLHNELKLLAIGAEGSGTPVKLHLSTGVESCDPVNGILTLQNGKGTRKFDVIVGSDGIYSKIRTSVVGFQVDAPIAPVPAAAFRWMMPASALDNDPQLDWITREGVQGGRVTVSKNGNFLLCYPCRNKTLINNFAMHVDSRDQSKIARNEPATREQLLEVFKDYSPKYKAWLNKAENIRIWQLRTLPALHTWVNGQTCLLGDSAHAMFPSLGQGAAMVMEDAAVLSGLLPLGTKVSEVNERMRAYQNLRKDRTEFVAKESMEQCIYPFKRGFYTNSLEMQDFMMHYNAPKVAQDYYDKHFAKKEIEQGARPHL